MLCLTVENKQMEALSKEERELVQRSHKQVSSQARRTTLVWICVVAVLLGVSVVVAQNAWELAREEITWEEFLDTIAFFGVIASSVVFNSYAVLNAMVAQTTFVKIYH